MRVNVIHPTFLSDQHLVAEYREVKMGPKALSRSLGSLKGVDKKKISSKYTLNTGHTYFFYDKNTFLEKRLALIIEEMQFRGFQTNHTKLLDDKYDYHPNTFDPEWWGDWEPDLEALKINMERIDQRFFQKSLEPETKGWYKLFGYSVPDMLTLFNSRKNGYIYICPNCKAICEEKETYCWNCCQNNLANNLEKIILNKRNQKDLKENLELENLELVQTNESIVKLLNYEELKEWKDLGLYKDWLINNQFNLEEESKNILNFIIRNLKENDTRYDEFDLEDLCEVIKLIFEEKANNFILNILDLIISISDKNFIKQYFKIV